MPASTSHFSELVSDILALAAADEIVPNQKARPLKADDDAKQTVNDAIQKLSEIETAPPLHIRTIHHFSCTGGTMLAKCIASMANTVVLNEVDPLSAIPFRGDLDRFNPTDLVALMHQSGSPPEPDHDAPDPSARLAPRAWSRIPRARQSRPRQFPWVA